MSTQELQHALLRRAVRRRGPVWGPQITRSSSPRGDGPDLVADDLVMDPSVGLFDAVLKSNVRLPAQQLQDQRIVRIASAYPLGRVELVPSIEFDSRDLFGDVDQPIDGHQFGRAEVQRLANVAVHD